MKALLIKKLFSSPKKEGNEEEREKLKRDIHNLSLRRDFIGALNCFDKLLEIERGM